MAAVFADTDTSILRICPPATNQNPRLSAKRISRLPSGRAYVHPIKGSRDCDIDMPGRIYGN